MMFTRIALLKLSEILIRKKLIRVTHMDESNITLQFNVCTCNITALGNVTWVDIESPKKNLM